MTDTDRLDWVRRYNAQCVCALPGNRTVIRWWLDGWHEREFAGDFRAAIDAAREATMEQHKRLVPRRWAES